MKSTTALSSILLISVFIGSFLIASHVQAQFSITGGDLYVYQIGNNTTAGTVANPIVIDQFDTGGSLLNQVAVNSSATQGTGLVASGQSATEGSLALSPGDNALTFMGYSGIAVGTTGVNGQTTAAANRDIGMVDASGNFSIVSTSTTAYGPTAGAGRGAVTDGNGNYWAVGVGSTAGVAYYGNNQTASQVTTTGSARSIGIYSGNLYYTAGSSLYTVSAATTATAPTALITGSGTLDGFVFNPSMTTCYIANGAANGGIQVWKFNGTSWALSYTLDNTGANSSGFSFVTANFSGATPVLYATTLESGGVNSIEAITDNEVAGAAPTTVLDTTTETGGSETFGGIVFDPTSSVPEPSTLGLAGLGLIIWAGNRRFRGSSARRGAICERESFHPCA